MEFGTSASPHWWDIRLKKHLRNTAFDLPTLIPGLWIFYLLPLTGILKAPYFQRFSKARNMGYKFSEKYKRWFLYWELLAFDTTRYLDGFLSLFNSAVAMANTFWN